LDNDGVTCRWLGCFGFVDWFFFGVLEMKIIIFWLLLLVTLAVFAERVPSPDSDNDGITDWKECETIKNGIKCEERVDNCRLVKNINQFVSPNYMGDEDKAIGTACDYDIDGDGIPATIQDYGRLVNIVNTYYIICVDYETYTFLDTGSCDPAGNYIGDLTGGPDIDYLTGRNNTEYTTDGRTTYSDICVLIARNPILKAQLQLPYNTSCNIFYSMYNSDGSPK